MVSSAQSPVLVVEAGEARGAREAGVLLTDELRRFRATQPREDLRNLITQRPCPVVAVLDASRDALPVVRWLRQIDPAIYLIFVGASRDAADFHAALHSGVLIGAPWSLLHWDAPQFKAELAEQIQMAKRRRRYRAALSQANLQLQQRPAPEAQAMKRLVISERFLAAVVENSADAVITLSLAGQVLSWNRSAEGFWGLAAAVAVGSTFSSLVARESAERFSALMEQAAASRSVARIEMNVQSVRRRTTVESSLSPIFDAEGQLCAFSLVARDITQRKEAELHLQNQKEALEAIVRGKPLPEVLEFFTEWVEAFIPRAGIATILLADAAGEHLRAAAGRRCPPQWAQAVDGVRIGPGVGSCGTAAYRRERVIVADIATDPLWADFRDEALRHDLRACWSTPILAATGDVLGTFAIYYFEPTLPIQQEIDVVDVVTRTAAIAIERRRTEDALTASRQQLQGHAARLEERVAERTATLSEMIGEMEAFSYSVSHDLRAPLRSIESFARIILDDYGAALPPECREHAERIARNAQKMDRLTQDVIAFTRVAHGDLQKEAIDLDAALADVIEQYPDLTAARDHIHIAAPLGTVLAHGPSMVQCFSNLLQNAFKFVAEGRVPNVRVYSERCGDRVRTSVCDNGIGIDPAHQHRIFGIFERAGPANVPGTGIGLAIVKKAVERMGGKIGLESHLGAGARFWIDLPAA